VLRHRRWKSQAFHLLHLFHLPGCSWCSWCSWDRHRDRSVVDLQLHRLRRWLGSVDLLVALQGKTPKKKRPFRTRMSKNVKECHLYFQCHFECHLGCLCQYHKLMLSTPFNNFFQHIQSFSPCASHRMACSMIHPSASPSPWPSLNVDSSTKPRWRPAHRRRKS